MAVNKVVYGGNTLIDLTGDSVTAATLKAGVTAHGANGEAITGTMQTVLQDKTVTPSESAQSVTADAGYDGLDTVTVNAIPGTYVKPTVTKGATTYTPKTTAQTIAAGTYCSGAQTIAGDANLVAANILSGKTIFGVAGSASSGAKVKIGTFTVSNTSTKSYAIEHGLGATPNFAIAAKISSTSATSISYILLSVCRDEKANSASGSISYATTPKAQSMATQNITWDSSKVTFASKTGSSSINIYGEYAYLIGVF